MANLTEIEEYTAGIYRFEETDVVQGGPGGIDNLPTNQLANRTKWLKAQVEALLASIAAIDLSYLAPLAGPVLTGDPKAPTAAQFDNDTSIANTAFVQRALGNHNGLISVTANTSLNASAAGAIVQLADSANYTVVLPPTTGLPDGAAVELFAVGTGFTKTISAAAGETITAWGNALGTFSLRDSGNLIFTKRAGEWRMVGGTLSLKYASNFLLNSAASGWQIFPSGLILQWGAWTASSTPGAPVPVTFPMTFPNQRIAMATLQFGASSSLQSAWADSPTNSGFNGRAAGTSVACNFITVGN